jgi:predicted alpha/beta-fold hydrolase
LPSTCGWKEAEDVLAAARFLLETTCTSTVGAIGYSLGGAAVLNAAAHELAPELLRGGVLSESGFADARDVVAHLAERPPMLSPEFLVYWIFRIGFAVKFRATGLGGTAIATYPEQVVARRLHVDLDELWDRASVVRRVAATRVPALHLHAVDDWVVPVAQALAIREEAAGNPLVGVCIRPRGAHCAFDRVMGPWRHDLARRFFAAAAGVELGRPGAPTGPGADMRDIRH